jgi:glyoxylase-like metal-dependent hydrolase (beta-lactamase superfamily II)
MFNHDGSVTTLEEWFDPARLRERLRAVRLRRRQGTRRAVPGHDYGLRLTAEDTAALIAFLKTL